MPFTSFIPITPVLGPREDLSTTFSIENELRASGFEPTTVAFYILDVPAGRKMSTIYGRNLRPGAVGHITIGVGAVVTGPGGPGMDGAALTLPNFSGGISGGGGGGAGRPPGAGGLGITRDLGTTSAGNPGTSTTGGDPGDFIDGATFGASFAPIVGEPFGSDIYHGGHGMDIDHLIHLVHEGELQGGGGGGVSWQGTEPPPENRPFVGGDLGERGGSASPFFGRPGQSNAGKALIYFFGVLFGDQSTITGSGTYVGDIEATF